MRRATGTKGWWTPVNVSQARILEDDGIGIVVRVNGEEVEAFNSRISLSPVCGAAYTSAGAGGEDDSASARDGVSAAECSEPGTWRWSVVYSEMNAR